MAALLYITAIIFLIMGTGTSISGYYSKHIGVKFGGLCYLVSGIAAIAQHNWLPLLIGFPLIYIIRAVFGDPSMR